MPGLLTRTAVSAAMGVLMCSGAAAVGADQETADPAIYLQAFNDTCRRGFPDLEVIASNATAQGWQESKLRPISGSADALPAIRAFHRNGLMLFLTRPPEGQFRAVCQVGGGTRTQLAGADIAEMVSRSLNAGEPVFQKTRKSDTAVWTVAPSITVEAGVLTYRKARTISISARQGS